MAAQHFTYATIDTTTQRGKHITLTATIDVMQNNMVNAYLIGKGYNRTVFSDQYPDADALSDGVTDAAQALNDAILKLDGKGVVEGVQYSSNGIDQINAMLDELGYGDSVCDPSYY